MCIFGAGSNGTVGLRRPSRLKDGGERRRWRSAAPRSHLSVKVGVEVELGAQHGRELEERHAAHRVTNVEVVDEVGQEGLGQHEVERAGGRRAVHDEQQVRAGYAAERRPRPCRRRQPDQQPGQRHSSCLSPFTRK